MPLWLSTCVLATVTALAAAMVRQQLGAGWFLPAICFMVCLLAAGFDAGTLHIPNTITYSGILLGLALNSLWPLWGHLGYPDAARWLGVAGAGQSLAGLGICGGIGLACLLFGMGGGDVKLLAAVGALLGWSQAWPVLLYALLIAVAYALANLFIAGRLNKLLQAVAVRWLHLLYFRQVKAADLPSESSVPLAVPLVLGLLASRILDSQRLWLWLGERTARWLGRV